MSNDTLAAVELNIKQAKEVVAMASALERLQANRDFKLVVTDGYFQKEAIRLVHLKADDKMQEPKRQDAIIAQIDAIGRLHAYFTTVYQLASMAEKAIEADEATIEEIAREELEENERGELA